jgi:hypothetical protein
MSLRQSDGVSRETLPASRLQRAGPKQSQRHLRVALVENKESPDLAVRAMIATHASVSPEWPLDKT